jgi:ribose-phosphate pyrophosphokinase
MVLVGDVQDRIAILVDDMADTCGSLVKAGRHGDAARGEGSRSYRHARILSGNAIETLNGNKLVEACGYEYGAA